MAGSSYGFWLQEVESIRHEECRVEGFRMKGRTKLGAESSALNWKKLCALFCGSPAVFKAIRNTFARTSKACGLHSPQMRPPPPLLQFVFCPESVCPASNPAVGAKPLFLRWDDLQDREAVADLQLRPVSPRKWGLAGWIIGQDLGLKQGFGFGCGKLHTAWSKVLAV